MRMKNFYQTSPAALMVATCLSFGCSSAAFANNFQTDARQLPDASKIERSRLQFQIVDQSPRVTDTRHPEENTVYQINVPPAPRNITHVVQIGAPTGVSDNTAGGTSVPISQNSLPFAGSHSNISPNQSLANHLPNGTSSRALSGTLARKPAQTPTAATPPTQSKPLAAVQPKPVASYAPVAASTGVGQSTSSKTHVVGELLHPEKNK